MNSISFYYVWQLFKKPFLLALFITLISFFLNIALIYSMQAYESILEDTFASKQAHIKIKYLSDEKILNYDERKKNIKRIRESLKDKIQSVHGYIESDQNIELQALGFNVIHKYYGAIRFLGYYFDDRLTLDIDSIKAFRTEQSDTYFTSMELEWQMMDKPTLIMNQAFHQSITPKISFETNVNIYSAKNSKNMGDMRVLGYINDYKAYPVIYASAKSITKLASMPSGVVTGYLVNINNLNELDTIQDRISNIFKDEPVIITNWLEENIKQKDLFDTFAISANVIKAIITFLTIILLTLIFFKSVLEKQPSIRIFNMLGLKIQNAYFLVMIVMIISSLMFAWFGIHTLNGYIVKSYEFVKNIKTDYPSISVDIFIMFSLFMTIFILLNRHIFSIKYDSLR